MITVDVKPGIVVVGFVANLKTEDVLKFNPEELISLNEYDRVFQNSRRVHPNARPRCRAKRRLPNFEPTYSHLFITALQLSLV